MPGPCNSKKKRKQQEEKDKAKRMKNLLLEVLNTRQLEDETLTNPNDSSNAPTSDVHPPQCQPPPPPPPPSIDANPSRISPAPNHLCPPTPLQRPFIHNPGNGPRVTNMSAYLASFFVPPPALDDPLSAAFASGKDRMLEMLEGTLGLPREVALIVWYNKTRKLGRVCPACQRIYRLGDVLSDPISNIPLDPRDPATPPWVLREQHISGLCSAPCFTLAAYTSHPYVANVVYGAWGRLAYEIDEGTAGILAAPRAQLLGESGERRGGGSATDDDQGLGTVLRVTRLADLGMAGMFGFGFTESGAEGKEEAADSREREKRLTDGRWASAEEGMVQ